MSLRSKLHWVVTFAVLALKVLAGRISIFCGNGVGEEKCSFDETKMQNVLTMMLGEINSCLRPDVAKISKVLKVRRVPQCLLGCSGEIKFRSVDSSRGRLRTGSRR